MKEIIQKLNKWLLILAILCSAFGITSCKKLVESPIPTEFISETNVYSTDATSIAVLDGIYISMNANFKPFQGAQSINLLSGLSADELSLYNGISSGLYYSYYTNSLSQSLGSPNYGAEFWSPLYNYIFKCNAAIEGLNKSNSLTPAIKQQLLGEAKFLRAFYYFYLVNLFGDLPLVLSTDPNINALLKRSPKDQVYQQMIADLKDAEASLRDNFLDGTLISITSERIRPTKWAAAALLARVYLYDKQFDKAQLEASTVINNTSLFGPLNIVSLNSVFTKNSREAIWQLQPTDVYFNTQEAQTMVVPTTGLDFSHPVYLSNNLLGSFETGDQRAVTGKWINSVTVTGTTYYFPYKYKKNLVDSTITPSNGGTSKMTEYFMILRLGEQYLIRAECKAQLGDINGAQADLNLIRNRAGLPNTTAGDPQSLLTAILHERQVELFAEWGNRWLDLKRTGNVDAIMNVTTPQKSNNITIWQSYQQLYPLPYESDLKWALNLVQNPGYN